jgi:hypothetical protein
MSNTSEYVNGCVLLFMEQNNLADRRSVVPQELVMSENAETKESTTNDGGAGASPRMMTIEEIQAANINLDMAREALAQADKRLVDTLATKDALERKAGSLFGGYVTGALALFGVGATQLRDGATLTPITFCFLSSGALLLLGLALLAIVFFTREYGATGSTPCMWLRQGTIDAKDSASALPHMLAYICFYHDERIKRSERANLTKVELLQWAIVLGVAAPVPLLILLFLR